MFEVAIVGAGASGLVAALSVARRGKRVVVFEKNSKIGKKLLATGNGRCNISNKSVEKSNFHSNNPGFVESVLGQFSTSACRDFFEELGIEFKEGQKGRLYPMSLKSSSVVDLLVYECKRVGVEFRLSSEVKRVKKIGESFYLFIEDEKIQAKVVLLATGSLAFGGSSSGYEFAKEFGHKVLPIFPSLVQLVCKENLKEISGVKVEALVEVCSEPKESSFGDLLFTNYGVSGSVILDVSRIVSLHVSRGESIKLKIDLFSELSKEALKNRLKNRLKFANQKSVELWLDGFLNPKLAKFFAKKVSKIRADELNQRDLTKLAYELKNMEMLAIETKGFKSAEVCAGGIDTKAVNSKTMESKLVKGLYFSGEILDVDGDCGGYNLHFAWASGFVSANSICDML